MFFLVVNDIADVDAVTTVLLLTQTYLLLFLIACCFYCQTINKYNATGLAYSRTHLRLSLSTNGALVPWPI